MNNKTVTKQPINFKLHLILFLATLTFWMPFYNLVCFKKLNELANYPQSKESHSTKNALILNFLLILTFIGAPFAFYKRYRLLRNYIAELGAFREPPAKNADKENVDESIRLNCIAPKKFVAYAITTFILVCSTVTSFTLSIYHLTVTPSWSSDAFMILLPLGMASLVTSFGFFVRTVKEEQYWVKAFNNIKEELSVK